MLSQRQIQPTFGAPKTMQAGPSGDLRVGFAPDEGGDPRGRRPAHGAELPLTGCCFTRRAPVRPDEHTHLLHGERLLIRGTHGAWCGQL